MLSTITVIRTTLFQANRFPSAERIPESASARGIAPSSTPCGQRYLQKNVETLAARVILEGKVSMGDTITFDVVDGKLAVV